MQLQDLAFKHSSWDDYYAVSRDSDTDFILNGASYRLVSSVDSIGFETNLPVLYKQDSKGEWQEMYFSLIIGTPTGTQMVNSILHPTKAQRDYTSTVKTVPSKVYSLVCQERLYAKWMKKQDRDGWTTDKNVTVLGEPTLLHHWDLHKDKMTYPALIGPKYNGIRATFKYEEQDPDTSQLLSRKRAQFTIPDLEAQLKVVGLSLDGELWKEGTELEDIVSLVRHGDRDIKLMVFDCIIKNPSTGYPERLSMVIEKLKGQYLPNIQVVPVAVVNNAEEAELFFNQIKKMPGVDGAVVRAMKPGYEFNVRSYGVLKIKDLMDSEYKCSNMVYDSDPIGKLAKMEFTCDDVGDTFLYVPDKSKEERAQMYRDFIADPNSYIGHTYTLYYREKTKRGLPRHILSMNLREYE